MEIDIEQRVYKVSMRCDKCNKGFMIQTGYVHLTYPAQYEHKCDDCGHIESYPIMYPTIRYK